MTIQDYAQQLLLMMGVDAEVSVQENEEDLVVQIDVGEDEAGLMIGYHGETLTAMQRVMRVIFHDQLEQRLVVNVNDYREQRREQVEEMAIDLAYQVLDTGRPYQFRYLPANERFIVHTTIADHEDFGELTTYSQGEGRDRRLMIDFADNGGEPGAPVETAEEAPDQVEVEADESDESDESLDQPEE